MRNTGASVNSTRTNSASFTNQLIITNYKYIKETRKALYTHCIPIYMLMHTAHSDQSVKPVLHYWPLQVAQNNHNIPAPIPAASVTRHQLRDSEY